MNRWLAVALLLVALVGFALRWPDLAERPMHNDEAVNAILFQRLWERGDYRYDPDEFHGPLLPYATLPFAWLSGADDFDHLSERTLRAVTVAAGVALLVLVGGVRPALGTLGTVAAAGFLALSPAMVFYSRYYIHEMWLVLFSLLLLMAGWRYGQTPRARWAALIGLSLGLLHATKETFVLSLAAMGFAGLLVARGKRPPTTDPAVAPRPRPCWKGSHVALALGVAAAVSVTLFTSGFTNPRGPLDAVLTYLPWLRRAGGHTPHVYPWFEYLHRLFWFQAPRGPLWTEGFLGVLALLGVGVAFGRWPTLVVDRRFLRFLAIYTLTLASLYSAITYKTPWCLLNFLLPLALLAGVGAAALLHGARRRTWPVRLGVAGVLLAGSAHLGWQSWQVGHAFAADRRNPYVYSPTVRNALELVARVEAIAQVSAEHEHTAIKVIAPDSAYWPLPWYLRRLREVTWLDQLPADPYAPIILVAAGMRAALDERSNKRYLSVGYYELRPREFFELYVEFELWKRFVATLPRTPDE